MDLFVDWYCPECGLTERTKPLPNRWHQCARLHGLTAPLVRKGIAAKLEARLREDYVGGELVQTAPEDGRPYMSIVTTRDEGTDAVVFAPTATAKVN